jgi:hypothetical protein
MLAGMLTFLLSRRELPFHPNFYVSLFIVCIARCEYEKSDVPQILGMQTVRVQTMRCLNS